MSDLTDQSPCAACRRPILALTPGVALCPWCAAGECRFAPDHGLYVTYGAIKQHYQAVHNIAPVVST